MTSASFCSEHVLLRPLGLGQVRNHHPWRADTGQLCCCISYARAMLPRRGGVCFYSECLKSIECIPSIILTTPHVFNSVLPRSHTCKSLSLHSIPYLSSVALSDFYPFHPRQQPIRHRHFSNRYKKFGHQLLLLNVFSYNDQVSVVLPTSYERKLFRIPLYYLSKT